MKLYFKNCKIINKIIAYGFALTVFEIHAKKLKI